MAHTKGASHDLDAERQRQSMIALACRDA